MTKHDKTLQKILQKPTSNSLKYQDAISYLRNIGANVDETRAGSNVMVKLPLKDAEEGDRPVLMNLHKPHPEKELKSYMVKNIRELLKKAGYIG